MLKDHSNAICSSTVFTKEMARSTENRKADREFNRLKDVTAETLPSFLTRASSNIHEATQPEPIDSAGPSRSSEPSHPNDMADTNEPPIPEFVSEEATFSDELSIDRFLQNNDEEEEFEDSDVEEEENHSEIADIASTYVTWVSKYNISGIAADEFLNYLRENHFPFLPKSIKTLRQKAYTMDAPIRDMGEGQFLYFGIKNIIIKFLDIANVDIQLIQHFKIGFGIDGIPISKSSKSNFWPILTRLNDYPAVLPVAVFYGRGKPQCVEDYLMEFAEELQEILRNGMQHKDIHLNFSIGPLVFDAQAKCFVHDIVSPTGFNACPKCLTEGKKINHRMVFPNLMAELRTEESFLNVNDPIHRHAKLPPLAGIGFDCISNTAIDYMHLSCQGVFKTLLNFWINTTTRPYSLNNEHKAEINHRILMIRRQLVSDFARKPRTLQEFSHYKATEFRQMLIYTGPILFKKVVKKQYYDHFMLLNAAHRILCHPEQCVEKNEVAEDYLNRFVYDFKYLYGEHYLVYNFHVLIHLAKECIHFNKPLDGFSAFCYENFLQKIIKMLKRAPYPLEQLRNRLQELLYFRPELFTEVMRKNNKTIRIPGSNQFEEIFTEKYVHFAVEGNDCYALKDNAIFEINDINKVNGRFVLTCKTIQGIRSFYGDSQTYGLFYCNSIQYARESVELDASECSKVLRLNLSDVYLFASILHSE